MDNNFKKSSERTAVVVGSGISGMTAAYRLQQAGFSVRVLESESIVGGRMTCRRIDGYTMNRASTLLAGQYEFLTGLIKEVGLGHNLEYQDFKIGTFRNKKIYGLRTNHMVLDSLFSGLLGWRSKLLMIRVLRDAKKARKLLNFADLSLAESIDTESAASYARRCLNKELLDYVVDPGIAALLATTAERPSVVDFLFTMAHYIGMGAYRYDGGIDFLISELARRIPVETNSRVLSVIEKEKEVEIVYERDGKQNSETFASCVIGVSAHQALKLHPQLTDTQKKILAGYEYSTIMVGHFGLSSPPDIDSHFIQVPPCEIPGLVNMYFPHLVGKGVVPAGKGMAVSYFSDPWSRKRMDWSDEEIINDMIPLVDKIIPNVRRKIEVTNVERWQPALFLSKPGSYKAMADFKREVDPTSRVQLAGDYFSFTSTNASAASGDIAARRLIDAMNGARRQ